MKTIFISLFIFLIGCRIVYGEGAQTPSEGDAIHLYGINNPKVSELIAIAIANNSDIAASLADIKIREAMESVESSLDNPRFEFGMDTMTTKMFSISEEFPFFGKLSLKSDIAKIDTKLSRTSNIDLKNNLIMDVKLAYLQIEFIDRSIELTEKNKGILKDLVKIAETKYAVGNGLQQDVLKSQLELSSILNGLIILKQNRQSAVVRLFTLLNRANENTPFEPTAPLIITPFNKTLAELKEMAINNSPVLSSGRLDTDKAQLKYNLAHKGYYPDFELKLSYTTANSIIPDFFTATIGVSIPLWFESRQKKEVTASEFEIKRSQEQYNSALNNLTFKLKEVLSKIEATKDQVELYKTGIIPQAELSLQSAISGYQVNNIDFLTLSNTQSELYRYEIDYNQLIKEHEAAIAELSAIVGLELFSEGSALNAQEKLFNEGSALNPQRVSDPLNP